MNQSPGDGPFMLSSTPDTTEVFGASDGLPTARPDDGSGSSTGGAKGGSGSNSGVVATITTTGFMGQEVTFTTTFDAPTFATFTTTNILGAETTIVSPTSYLYPPSSSPPIEPSGSETTFTSTNSLGFPIVVTSAASRVSFRTPALHSQTPTPADSSTPSPTDTTFSSQTMGTTVAAPDPASQPEAQPPPPAPTSVHHGMSGGQIAAAVVVPIIVVLLLIALAFVFLRRRRQRRRSRALEASRLAGPEVGQPPPPAVMREPSRDYFAGHDIPAAHLGAPEPPAPATATEDVTPSGRHPLENVRTGPPPTAFRDSTRLSSSPGSREVSAVFSSSSGGDARAIDGDATPYSSSATSDPFRDPRLAVDVGTPFSNFSASEAISPVSPQQAPVHDRHTLELDRPVSPPSRHPSAVSRASKLSYEEGDDASVISVGEAAVGDVRAGGGRASVVQLRRGSGNQRSSS